MQIQCLPKRPQTVKTSLNGSQPAEKSDPQDSGDKVKLGQATPEPERGPLGKAVHWLDEYTKPRQETAGDLEQNSYIQPMFHAVPAGFAFMGMQGIGIAASSSLVATAVSRHTKSRVLTFAAGAASGAAVAAGLGALTGSLGPAAIVGGGLLGAVQAFRGDKAASVRDASGNATLISGLFLPGTSKIAGAVASGIGASLGTKVSPLTQAAVGAASGAALGLGLSVMGLAPGGMALTIGLSAAAGGLGPLFGPRFSQGFRNLAQDSGAAAVKGLEKLGVPKGKINEDVANGIGSFPSQFLKEGLRGFVNSDFQISGMLVGGAIESLELVELFWEQKKRGKEGAEGPDGHSSKAHHH